MVVELHVQFGFPRIVQTLVVMGASGGNFVDREEELVGG